MKRLLFPLMLVAACAAGDSATQRSGGTEKLPSATPIGEFNGQPIWRLRDDSTGVLCYGWGYATYNYPAAMSCVRVERP